MTSVQKLYDQFKSDLKNTVPKIDPNLAHDVIYLENKLKNDKILERYKDEYKDPFAEFYINCEGGINLDEKIEKLRKNKNLKATTTDKPNQVFIANRMNIDDFVYLSEDSDIREITGTASPILRS